MIGIISDTHDNTDNVQKAVEIFKKSNVDFVIHCGDLCAPVTIRYFEGLVVHFVKGNVDGAGENIKRFLEEMGGFYYDRILEMEYEGKRIAALHYNEMILKQMIDSQKYDYIFHGHTHRIRDERIGRTRIINPGTHYLAHKENHYIVLLDVEKDKAEFIKIR